MSEFLKDTKEEKSFFETDKEIFKEETPEEKPEETEEVKGEEKPLPFHKDPKVQRYVEKQISKALEGKSETHKFIQEVKGEEPTELMDALIGLIGNDTPEKQRALKAFEKRFGDVEVKASERAVRELQAEAQRKAEEDRKAQRELDDAFEEIEDAYSVDLTSNAPGARKTRSDFVEYVRKIAPKNEDGEVTAFPDLNAAFEEFQERAKRLAPNNTKAKELAARSMSRSSEAATQPTGGKTWKDVDKMLNQLG